MVSKKTKTQDKGMVKVWYSLYDRMLNRDNLVQAFLKVKSSKGSGGIDGQTIQDLSESLSGSIDQLLTELRGKSYQPQPVRRVEIPKPAGGVRLLGIPTAKGKCTL
jgi:RNA-directed DNA polymerase